MIHDLTARTRLGCCDLVPFLHRDAGREGVELLDWERRPAVLALTDRGWHVERIAHATGLRVADVREVLAGSTVSAPSVRPTREDVRARRAAERVLVDGRLVHPGAPHGQPSGYTHWMCRCVPCSASQSAYKARPKARHGYRRAA